LALHTIAKIEAGATPTPTPPFGTVKKMQTPGRAVDDFNKIKNMHLFI